MLINRQDAIDELQHAIDLIKQNGKDWIDERDIPILEMAIHALQEQDLRQDTIEEVKKHYQVYWK